MNGTFVLKSFVLDWYMIPPVIVFIDESNIFISTSRKYSSASVGNIANNMKERTNTKMNLRISRNP